MQPDILANLNGPQREAVCHTEGPLLILAGAGSGKTRVLTHRIAQLLMKGVPPWQILAVTFTNKAAQEMRERVMRLVGPGANSIWVSTFHTACVRILRQEIPHLGYDKNFVIFDSQDQQVVIKNALKELNLSDKNYQPKSMLGAISKAKNELIGPDEYGRKAADFWANTVARVYQLYQRKLHSNNGLDFDDLIMYTVRIFREFPQVLEKYQERFRYILVDEYQDTNHAQYALVNLLAKRYRNLCVVGDDDQSIYSFRCADIRNILEFERDFPEVTIIKLEQNYRSTKNILNTANSVIQNNRERKSKSLWTENATGDKIRIFQAPDEREEARFVAEEIRRLVSETGLHYNEIALLYRTNAQSRSFEEALIQRGLPYRVIGGFRFYERKEIKDILAYLRLIYNPKDKVSLARIINVPKRGIGEASFERFLSFLEDNQYTIPEGFAHLAEIPGLNTRGINPLQDFYQKLLRWVNIRETSTVRELTEAVLKESGYLAGLRSEGTFEAQARLENLDEFLNLAAEFEKESDDQSLAAFLETVALVADVDSYQEDNDSLVLMTLHSAKGLEFPVVFLVGMEEGLFPHNRAVTEAGELEEERRLCYVGITRAKQLLYLTYAEMRLMYGQLNSSIPSRFLMELPKESIMILKGATGGNQELAKPSPATLTGPLRTARQGIQHSKEPAAPLTHRAGDWDLFQPGTRVNHPKWGIGTIITKEGTGSGAQVKVAFPGLGIKSLILSYANLEKAD
ncbi:MAG: DNA helicase PcrA [Firmicutes bacterium]|nr:DNA helicase PcrA [Bacillota bacterium]